MRKNLIQSGAEAVNMGKRGGIASGAARRRKRDLRFALLALMDGVQDGQTGTERLAAVLFKRALQGDTKAIALVVSWVNAAHQTQENEELGIEF